MLIYDILDKEKVLSKVADNLRALGIKSRIKRNSKKFEIDDKNCSNKKVFNTPLSQQPFDGVQLSSGAVVYVPKFVKQTVNCLEKHINHEGLFRKAGSQSRQKDLISRLDHGKDYGDKYQPVDVANCLKKYLRSLPDPLIPYKFHDTFVRCGILKNASTPAILLTSLLLPITHLSTLAFIMDFLKKVASCEAENKMSVDNLAKVLGPTIMPLQETTMSAMQARLDIHISIVKCFIENADKIGILPQNIANAIQNEYHNNIEAEINRAVEDKMKEKIKKHRNGSLTRMLNGLRKIVGRNGSPEAVPPTDASNQLSPLTEGLPLTGSPTKKRRIAELSSQATTVKKKRDSLDSRDDSSTRLLSMSPVLENQNVESGSKRKGRKENSANSSEKTEKHKKLGLNLDRFVTRSKSKINDLGSDKNDKNVPSKSPIERRWSSSNIGTSKKQIKKSKSQNIISSSASASAKRVNGMYKKVSNDYDQIFKDSDVNLSCESIERDNSTRQKHKLRYSDNITSMNSKLKENLIKKTDQEMEEIKKNVNVKEKIKDKTPKEYVKVPKSEYEEIKNRVSAIESRISQEFNNVIKRNEIKQTLIDKVSQVQNEYEKTLSEANIESIISADHIARRLSKELKIRRSAEHKVIRSPSARRISSLRRRSQEKIAGGRIKNHLTRSTSCKLSRKSSLNDSSMKNTSISYCSDETNARLSYLHQQLTTLISHTAEHTGFNFSDDDLTSPILSTPTSSTSSKAACRASSFHGKESKSQFNTHFNDLRKSNRRSNTEDETHKSSKYSLNTVKIESKKYSSWKDADVYLESTQEKSKVTFSPKINSSSRASVAELRTQNAGMVLAKAKLFDHEVQTSKSHQQQQQQQLPKRRVVSRKVKDAKTPPSIESSRRRKSISPKNIRPRGGKLLNQSPGDVSVTPSNLDSQRFSPSLDQENSKKKLTPRISGQKSVSHRRESIKSTPGQKTTINLAMHNLQMNSPSEISALDNINTPLIKKPLSTKTPKSARSLARRPIVDSRRTPLKAVPQSLDTPRRQSPRIKSRQPSKL